MKEEKRILNVLGQVDEKYIDEAAPGKKANKKPAWKKWTSIAACLALVAVLGVGALQSGWFSSNDIARLDGGETISFVKANTMPGALSLDLDVNTRALTEEETEALFADMPVAANAIFAADDNKLSISISLFESSKYVLGKPVRRLGVRMIPHLSAKNNAVRQPFSSRRSKIVGVDSVRNNINSQGVFHSF